MVAAAEALAARGVTVSVGLAGMTGRLAEHVRRVEAMGIPVLMAGGPLAAGKLGVFSATLRREAARQASRLLDQTRADWVVVNLPTLERGGAIADAVLARSPAVQLVGYLHLGQLPSVIGARYLAALRDRLAPRHLARFDLLLAVSRATADQVAALVSRPVHTVYPASPSVHGAPHLDRAAARCRLGLGDGPVVGLVGRVDFRQKGHDTAVLAARRLADRGMVATWAVIGDGPDLGRMRRMVARMDLTDRFAFLGWRGDVPNVLPALDVLAMPSRFEGLPLTAVEGVSARIPVVAFAVDGLVELLAPPFAVPPDDQDAFARTLAQVLDHPESWPAEEQAARAIRLCDPSKVADRILAALKLGAFDP